MKKDPNIFLSHIFESIELIEKYSKKATYEDFVDTIQLQDSIMRRLEIIGEAVKILSEEIKKKNDLIPWREIAGLRDILSHQYFGIDLELTWEVVKKDLPVLKGEILKLLNDQGGK